MGFHYYGVLKKRDFFQVLLFELRYNNRFLMFTKQKRARVYKITYVNHVVFSKVGIKIMLWPKKV